MIEGNTVRFLTAAFDRCLMVEFLVVFVLYFLSVAYGRIYGVIIFNVSGTFNIILAIELDY